MRDAFGLPQTALVLGGGSDIAVATLRQLAGRGLQSVVLAGRDEARMAEVADRLPVERVQVINWDARNHDAHGALVEQAVTSVGDLDLVLCAVGSLGHAAGTGLPAPAVADLVETNFTGPATALSVVASHLERQGHGTIVVLSSVAATRPRKSNFVYGSAKAGLDAYARGTADALAETGVTVHVVRPGFVHTRMTAGLKPAPFSVAADDVAEAVVKALRSPKSSVVWVPSALGPIFAVLRALPWGLWRRIAGER